MWMEERSRSKEGGRFWIPVSTLQPHRVVVKIKSPWKAAGPEPGDYRWNTVLPCCVLDREETPSLIIMFFMFPVAFCPFSQLLPPFAVIMGPTLLS